MYMDTLNYYWEKGFDDQKDIFEGVVSTVPVKDVQGVPVNGDRIRMGTEEFIFYV